MAKQYNLTIKILQLGKGNHSSKPLNTLIDEVNSTNMSFMLQSYLPGLFACRHVIHHTVLLQPNWQLAQKLSQVKNVDNTVETCLYSAGASFGGTNAGLMGASVSHAPFHEGIPVVWMQPDYNLLWKSSQKIS